jgi:UDP-N-acetylglucosamine transferase subunit ALG13
MFLDFPRLIQAMDAIARDTGEQVVMQTGMSKLRPAHCAWFDFWPHERVLALQQHARVVVAHAGIGVTLDALHARSPLILVPREKARGEHMNDHQRDIAEAVDRRGWGRMITDMGALPDACAAPPPIPGSYRPAKAPLIAAVRAMAVRVAREKGCWHAG